MQLTETRASAWQYNIESTHFRPSRFPTGCPTCLPANAPATAATHSSPTTSPGGVDSSGSAPEDSSLFGPCWSAMSTSESIAGEVSTKRSPFSTSRESPDTPPAPSERASNMRRDGKEFLLTEDGSQRDLSPEHTSSPPRRARLTPLDFPRIFARQAQCDDISSRDDSARRFSPIT